MLSDVADGGHTSAITRGSVMGESTYMGLHNQVMTDQQMETLREQIRAYSVICSQLVEMHKDMSQQPCDPRLVTGQCMLYGLAAVTPGLKMSARQRWTPTQVQLQILESLFEQGNASANKQKVKEITNQLSQYGQISETNVYNWFQNRKARAKKKQMLLPQKESESEIETDDESPRRKKAKIESSSNPENVGPGQSDANAEIVERNHGNQPQFEFQDNALESLLSSENVAEVKHRASFDRTRPDVIANAGHGFIQSLSEVKPVHLSNTVGSSEHGMNQTKFSGSPIEVSSTVTVLLDGKPWKVPSGAFDVTRMRGDDTVLLDFHGHTVPTNGTGGGSYSLHANKSYTVPRPSDIVKGTSVKKSEGLLIQSLHQVANPLNEV